MYNNDYISILFLVADLEIWKGKPNERPPTPPLSRPSLHSYPKNFNFQNGHFQHFETNSFLLKWWIKKGLMEQFTVHEFFSSLLLWMIFFRYLTLHGTFFIFCHQYTISTPTSQYTSVSIISEHHKLAPISASSSGLTISKIYHRAFRTTEYKIPRCWYSPEVR